MRSEASILRDAKVAEDERFLSRNMDYSKHVSLTLRPEEERAHDLENRSRPQTPSNFLYLSIITYVKSSSFTKSVLYFFSFFAQNLKFLQVATFVGERISRLAVDSRFCTYIRGNANLTFNLTSLAPVKRKVKYSDSTVSKDFIFTV